MLKMSPSLSDHYLFRDLLHLPRRFVLDSTDDSIMSETVCYLKSDVEKK